MKLASSCTKQGEWAELCFMLRAIERGLIVSRPLTQAPYDLITDSNGAMRRVQIKSVSVPDRRQAGYRISSGFGGSSRNAYSAREIDLLAALIIPEDAWYIIPVSAFAPRKTIRLNPSDPAKDCFIGYREAWQLLLGRGPALAEPIRERLPHNALGARSLLRP